MASRSENTIAEYTRKDHARELDEVGPDDTINVNLIKHFTGGDNIYAQVMDPIQGRERTNVMFLWNISMTI
jgi:hypothetical protein